MLANTKDHAMRYRAHLATFFILLSPLACGDAEPGPCTAEECGSGFCQSVERADGTWTEACTCARDEAWGDCSWQPDTRSNDGELEGTDCAAGDFCSAAIPFFITGTNC
jgi:hypothetical protein